MGHTLLCPLGLFLLTTRLQCCHAEDALTLKTNWSTLYTGETVTLACDKSDGQDTDWSYTFTRNHSKLASCKTKKSSCSFKLTKNDNGQYQCSVFQTKTNSTNQSNIVSLTVLDNPKPALNVSRSWLSPGASVTLNCSVTDTAAGWRFYWYKAVANLSINSNYGYELLPGKSNRTENNIYVVNGQTHTAGYVCRAGRGNPVHYCWYSKPKFVWSGDSHAPSVKVSPDRVQHFSSEPVSLSCEGNQWRMVRFTEAGHLSNCSDWGRKNGSTWIIKNLRNKTAVYWCEFASGEFSNAVNITIQSDIILVSPVHPVTEGDSVRLSCKVKSGSLSSNVSFFRNNTLQNDTSAELRISAVSKSDEGFYMCRDAEKKSAQSWLSVKCAYDYISSSPGKMLLLIIGLVCGIVVFILLLLFCCCMKSKDVSFARTTLFQRTNQGFAPDQLVNLNETQPQHPSSHLHDESGDVTYSLIHLKDIRKTENSSSAEETVYSEVKLDKAPENSPNHPPTLFFFRTVTAQFDRGEEETDVVPLATKMVGGCQSCFFTNISVLLLGCFLHDVEASNPQREIHKKVGDTVELSSGLSTEGVTKTDWKYEEIKIADKEGVLKNIQFDGRLEFNPDNFSLTLKGLTLKDSGKYSFISVKETDQRPTVIITLSVHVSLEAITKEPIVNYSSTWHTSNASCTVLLECSAATGNVTYQWTVGTETFNGSRLQHIIRGQDEDTKFNCTISNAVNVMSTIETVRCSNDTSQQPETGVFFALIVGAGGFLLVAVIVGVAVCVYRHKQSQAVVENELTVYADITDVAIGDKPCSLYETIDNRGNTVPPGPHTVYDKIQLSRVRNESVSPYQEIS
ncbi:hypothetical protein NQZ68_038805 [Dissostichus eleginoides]|nr:hypothetical protein NQZ68_038805 [Dissostichus eleginoides]